MATYELVVRYLDGKKCRKTEGNTDMKGNILGVSMRQRKRTFNKEHSLRCFKIASDGACNKMKSGKIDIQVSPLQTKKDKRTRRENAEKMVRQDKKTGGKTLVLTGSR